MVGLPYVGWTWLIILHLKYVRVCALKSKLEVVFLWETHRLLYELPLENALWRVLADKVKWMNCWISFVLSSWQTLLNVYLKNVFWHMNPPTHKICSYTEVILCNQRSFWFLSFYTEEDENHLESILWHTVCCLLGAKPLETEWSFTSHLSSKVKWILFIRCHREQSSVKSKNLCILRIWNSLSSKACWHSQLFCKMSDFEDEPGTSAQIWIFCHFRLISSLWQDFIKLVLLQFEDAFFACYVS